MDLLKSKYLQNATIKYPTQHRHHHGDQEGNYMRACCVASNKNTIVFSDASQCGVLPDYIGRGTANSSNYSSCFLSSCVQRALNKIVKNLQFRITVRYKS